MGIYSRQGVEKSLQGVTLKEFASHSPVPPTVPDEPFSLDFKLSRQAVSSAHQGCGSAYITGICKSGSSFFFFFADPDIA